MIIVGRRLPSLSARRSKLHLKLDSVIVTSYSDMIPPQALSTDTPLPPPPGSPHPEGKAASDSDWNWSELSTRVFSKENKERTIKLLNVDRESFGFSFKSYGKSCRKAAVLVPLCFDVNGKPGLLMNLRSDTLKTHSGEISFPGGTFEPSDHNDPIVTALRETEEELGLSRDEIDFWTICRVFPTISTKLGVYPIVGLINSGPVDPDKLVINPDEVDHAFVLPFEFLCNPDNWDNVKAPSMKGASGSSLTIPVYKNLQQISPGLLGINLWGLTAFITHLLLSALIPEQYTRKVPFIELITDTQEDKQGQGESGESSGGNHKKIANEGSSEPSSKL